MMKKLALNYLKVNYLKQKALVLFLFSISIVGQAQDKPHSRQAKVYNRLEYKTLYAFSAIVFFVV